MSRVETQKPVYVMSGKKHFKNKKMRLKDYLEIIKIGWLKLLMKLVMMQ